ncbi:hypothetical protein [Bacillus sp. FJAT-47783]|uniref:hypothetical protein n=1 Tax=Bacillus sp. FJAT-47783 TaxID=2922712 RepID=UPI001FACE364|nr:hypothetical protein [Bacillus sp. FJAT-47783]
MTFKGRLILLVVGVHLGVIGGISLILDLNLYDYYTQDYSIMEFIQIITGRTSFYLLLVGFILIMTVAYYPKAKK